MFSKIGPVYYQTQTQDNFKKHTVIVVQTYHERVANARLPVRDCVECHYCVWECSLTGRYVHLCQQYYREAVCNAVKFLKKKIQWTSVCNQTINKLPRSLMDLAAVCLGNLTC